jgi:hypothetical protein
MATRVSEPGGEPRAGDAESIGRFPHAGGGAVHPASASGGSRRRPGVEVAEPLSTQRSESLSLVALTLPMRPSAMVPSRRRAWLISSACLTMSVAAMGGIGCRPKPPPRPKPDPASVSAAASSASASASASAVVPDAPPEIPTLVFQAVEKSSFVHKLYPIAGALMVAHERRVGRVAAADGTIEWIGKIPDELAGAGPTELLAVVGVWPGAVDVLYQSLNGRAPLPTYAPLTGTGHGAVSMYSGSSGVIDGLAYLGKTTLLATTDLIQGGSLFRTVRGPKLTRQHTTRKEAGCKEGDVRTDDPRPPPAAIQPLDVAGTPSGHLWSVGRLCENGRLTFEHWDAEGKPTIVPLPVAPGAPEPGAFASFLVGKGETLFLSTMAMGMGKAVYELRDGVWVALPPVPKDTERAFLSQAGELYLTTKSGISRWDEKTKAYPAVARWGSPSVPRQIGKWGDDFWTTDGAKLGKLVRGEYSDPIDRCQTPYVWLYRVSPGNERAYTFPTTRQALAGFPDQAGLRLVEITDTAGRELGVEVRSPEQGKALVAYLATAMKDETPQLSCRPIKKARVIEMGN